MLNEERVKHMTRIALFEKKEGRELQPMMHYSKRDYLTLNTIKDVIAGTLFYGVVYLGIVTLILMFLVSNLNMLILISGIVLGLLGYVIYLYYYLRYMYGKAEKRYDEGKRKLKGLAQEYRALEEMYHQEEKMEMPEGWD